MEVTDCSSMVFGILSLCLWVFAIIQSSKYKKLSDKIEEDHKIMLNEIKDNSALIAVISRKIDKKTYMFPQRVNLHKDELYVWKNSNYKPNRIDKIINKLNNELSRCIKAN